MNNDDIPRPRFVRSDTLLDVYKHVTRFRLQCQLDERGNFVFIFKKENSFLVNTL